MSKLYVLQIILFFVSSSLIGQVTIGRADSPKAGAMLDLRQEAKDVSVNATKGLGLPRVALSSLTDLYPMFENDISYVEDKKKEVDLLHTGMIVYNVSEDLCLDEVRYSSLYLWSGVRWDELPARDLPYAVSTFVDNRDISKPVTYRIGKFEDAGWWMLDNLRAEKWADGSMNNPVVLKKEMAYHISEGRFAPPRNDESLVIANPEYGYLYNWIAATANKDPGSVLPSEKNDPDQPQVQGICPEGWHLPSDYEWLQLIDVLNSSCNYGLAPSSTTPAHNMFIKKASNVTSDTKGKSRSYEQGGFNVVPLGYVYAGDVNSFGKLAFFWTSSAAPRGLASRFTAWNIGPVVSTGEYYNNGGFAGGNRSDMNSVRCKRD